jgi:hypothetical protein
MFGNIGYFRPNQEAHFIAQIINILIVLIMRKADGVGAHFENHFQVFAMHFLGDGASDPEAILMPGNAD